MCLWESSYVTTKDKKRLRKKVGYAKQTQHNTTDKRNKVKGNSSQQEETHTEVNYVKENIFKKR